MQHRLVAVVKTDIVKLDFGPGRPERHGIGGINQGALRGQQLEYPAGGCLRRMNLALHADDRFGWPVDQQDGANEHSEFRGTRVAAACHIEQ